MNRIALGAFGALLLAGAGFFWWQGRAAVERGAPPPDISAPKSTGEAPIELPTADPHRRGAALPGNGKRQLSTEERRFDRYDRNRDGAISRVEMLGTRVNAFKKLDTNHDNLLSFEEWAVKTSNRFKEIDRNGDGVISRAELEAYDAGQDAKKADRARARAGRCACGTPSPKAGKPAPGDSDDPDD